MTTESMGYGTCYVGGILTTDIQALFGTPEQVLPAGMVIMGHPDETPDLSMLLLLEAVAHKNGFQRPTVEDIKAWYKECEKIWEKVSEKKKEKLAKQNFNSIPQALAVQNYVEDVAIERSRVILENLRKAKFMLE